MSKTCLRVSEHVLYIASHTNEPLPTCPAPGCQSCGGSSSARDALRYHLSDFRQYSVSVGPRQRWLLAVPAVFGLRRYSATQQSSGLRFRPRFSPRAGRRWKLVSPLLPGSPPPRQPGPTVLSRALTFPPLGAETCVDLPNVAVYCRVWRLRAQETVGNVNVCVRGIENRFIGSAL